MRRLRLHSARSSRFPDTARKAPDITAPAVPGCAVKADPTGCPESPERLSYAYERNTERRGWKPGAGLTTTMTYQTSHRPVPDSAMRKLAFAGLVAPLILGLTACTGVTQFLSRAETKPASEPAPEVQAAQPEPIPEPQEKPKPGKLYEWDGDGRSVTRIVINTDEQKARFYSGDEQIGWTTVASGVSKYPTPVGHFEVMEKVENKRSNLYGKIYTGGGKVLRSDARSGRDAVPSGARFEGAKMPYFLRLTYDGIGLHAGPIPRPGRPASHGCIRMPSKMAPVVFKHVNVGTQVSIVGKGPSYGNYVQKQRVLAAQQAARAREQRAVEARRAAAAAATPALAAEVSGTARGSPQPGPIRAQSAPAESAATETAALASQAEATGSGSGAPAAALQAAASVDPSPSASPATVEPTPGPHGGTSEVSSTPVPATQPIPAAQPVPASAPVPVAQPAPVAAPAPPAAPPAAAPTVPPVVYPPRAPAYPMPQPPAYAPMMRPAFAPLPSPPAASGAAASIAPPNTTTGTQGGASAGAPSDG